MLKLGLLTQLTQLLPPTKSVQNLTHTQVLLRPSIHIDKPATKHEQGGLQTSSAEPVFHKKSPCLMVPVFALSGAFPSAPSRINRLHVLLDCIPVLQEARDAM